MKDERERLKNILERDKAEINESSHAAALADFRRVAEEYFETDGGFVLTMREGKRGKEVVFTFRVVRAKNFKTLGRI